MRSSFRRGRRFLGTSLSALLLLAAAPAWGSSPREELLRLVPEDVSLCLVLSNLRGHSDKMLTAPWVQTILDSPFGRSLAKSPEAANLTRFDTDVRDRLGINLAQLRDEILGDAVVLAYRHSPPGKPEEERGMVLLRARNADLLNKLVERVNKEQRESGELKALETREHGGLKYYLRKETKGDHFYYLSGPLLIFTRTEAMLRQALQLKQADRQLPRVARQVARLGADKALVTLWVNPRAFDQEIRERSAQERGPSARVVHTFLAYWQALEGLGVAVALDRDPELTLTVQTRSDAGLAPLRQLLQTAAVSSELWGRFPQDAVLTTAQRVDFVALSKLLGEFMAAEDRQAVQTNLQRNVGVALGLNFAEEVLPRLGPDCGLCVADAPDRSSFPHILFALRIQSGPQETPVDKAVHKALQFFVGLAVFDHNRTHADQIRIKSLVQDKVEGQYLVNDRGFPAGLQPAWALKDGYLLLASCPAALQRFGPPGPSSADVPVLRLSLRELSRLVQGRREQVAAFLAEKNHLSKEAAGRWVEGLLWGLELFDQVELMQRSEAGQVAWVLRARSAQKPR